MSVALSWIVLVAAGILEAVWAQALSASRGFRRRRPAILFLVACAASMVGLAYAMVEIPTGTAYAVWTGVGATLTVLWSLVTRQERATVLRILLLLALVGGIVGLKAVS